MSKTFRKLNPFRSRFKRSPTVPPRLDTAPSINQVVDAELRIDQPDVEGSSQAEPQIEGNPAVTTDLPASIADPYGLTVLYDPGNATVDIVFVHGLTGKSFSTWRHKSGVHWHKDLLKHDFAYARIMTYGYDVDVVNLFRPIAQDGLLGYAVDLVTRLAQLRSDNAARRDLYFVAHSLGGLLVKKAVSVSRFESEDDLQTIEESTIGISFLGTPHRGSDLALRGADLTSLASLVAQTNNAPVKTLEPNSEMLREVHKSFQSLLANRKKEGRRIEIICFYELLKQPVLRTSKIIVPKASAILDGERECSLRTTHSDMTRFASRGDANYDVIVREMRRVLERQKSKADETQRQAVNSDHTQVPATDLMDTLTEAARSCLIQLGESRTMDYQFELPKPVQGTCEWILQQPQYATWANGQSSLLWITGGTGRGKTTLSQFLVEHLEKIHRHSTTVLVCSHFCHDSTDDQKDARSLLRSLIFQMLKRRQSLLNYYRDVFAFDGAAFALSLPSLWKLFLNMVGDASIGTVLIILDAIDECKGDKTRDALLRHIMDFFRPAEGHEDKLPGQVRLLMTSRPKLSNDYVFNGLARCLFRIEGSSNHLIADIRLLVDRKVRDLVKKSICPPNSRDWLEDWLCSNADQTFLWVSLVLENLERDEEALETEKTFRAAVSEIPLDLRQTYQKFLSQIPTKSRERARKLLYILAGSNEMLTSTEINIASNITAGHKSLAELHADLLPTPEKRIHDVLGPLVSISKTRVGLIHRQSLKDFLFGAESEDLLTSPGYYAAEPQKVDLIMASACVSYLRLEDFNQPVAVRRSDVYDPMSTDSPTSFGTSDQGTSGDEQDWGLENFFTTLDDRNTIDEVFRRQHPFFGYAAKHWTKHLRSCLSIAPQNLVDSASMLLQQNNERSTTWLREYWDTTVRIGECPRRLDFATTASLCGIDSILETRLQSPIGCPQGERNTALFWAARMGFVSTVRMLLKYGADPNTHVLGSFCEHTPMMIAAQYGHQAVVECLLESRETDANMVGYGGRTALSFAASYGHLDVVQRLLVWPDILPGLPSHDLWTPLFWAAAADHTKIVEVLLQRTPDSDVNLMDKYGRTVATLAAEQGSLGSLKILMRRTAIDFKIRDHKGRSALSLAARRGHVSSVRVLLKRSQAVREDRDEEGRNPFSHACSQGHGEIVKLLISNGYPGLDEADIDGWTPLAWALDGGSLAAMEALISTGRVNVNQRDKTGRTPLAWATVYGQPKTVAYLLQSGADPTIADSDGLIAQDLVTRLPESVSRDEVEREFAIYNNRSKHVQGP